MACWLVKSEPESYAIADLARDGTTTWEGVRNYQARNFLKAMKLGDRALFYHSNATPSGVAGVCEVAREAYPDPTQFDPDSAYHDADAKPADPRWVRIDVRHVETLPHFVTLAELKADAALVGMEVVRKGSRLSVTAVSDAHFARVLALGRSD